MLNLTVLKDCLDFKKGDKVTLQHDHNEACVLVGKLAEEGYYPIAETIYNVSISFAERKQQTQIRVYGWTADMKRANLYVG